MNTSQRHEDRKIVEQVSSVDAPVLETERLASAIVDSAFRVHSTLGPGLIESVDETCVCHELNKREIPFRRQVAFPIAYDGLRLDAGLRIDLLVAESIIVELKSVEILHPVYEAQLLSYLRLTGIHLGFLINFNVRLIRDGIKRVII